MRQYRSIGTLGKAAPAANETSEFVGFTSLQMSSVPLMRTSLGKKYSQPLSRHKDEEVRMSVAEPSAPAILEQTLLKELEENLKFSEKSESGLTSDLKTVRRVLQTYIRENPRTRSLLTRIWTFYEETALRLQREVEFLKKQTSKLNDDKVLLEKALIQVTEKQMMRNSTTNPVRIRPEKTNIDQSKRPDAESDNKKIVKAASVANFSPTVKRTFALARPAPVPPSVSQVVSRPVSRAPDKPYKRPRSVPKLNLDPILKNRSRTLFIHYSETTASTLVSEAMRRVSTALICEVLSEGLTAEAALRICERIYTRCHRPFGPKLWVTVSAIGLGRPPKPGSTSGPVFAHDSYSTARAKMSGFTPEIITVPRNSDGVRTPLCELPQLPYELAGFGAVAVGGFETVGVSELLVLSASGLLSLARLRVEATASRSLALAKEEIVETANVLIPTVEIDVGKGTPAGNGVELRSEQGETMLSLSIPGRNYREMLNSRSEDCLESLEKYWNATAEGFRIEAELSQYWFEKLCRLYSDARRSYHTLSHVYDMLAKKEAIGVESGELDLAIWFHDAVYWPKGKDNEEQSAALFGSFCVSTQLESLSHIQSWILSTKTHTLSSDSTLEKLLLDLDLSIFASEEEKYRKYAEGIFTEYAWVGEDVYRRKRTEVMREFLKRDRIYYSDFGREMENTARRNVLLEIERLENLSIPLCLFPVSS